MFHRDIRQRNLEIIYWIQSRYGGRKVGKFLGRDNQWIVGSYFQDDDKTLVLHLAQGNQEGRVSSDPAFLTPVVLDSQSFEDFKLWFRSQLS